MSGLKGEAAHLQQLQVENVSQSLVFYRFCLRFYLYFLNKFVQLKCAEFSSGPFVKGKMP